MSGGTDLLVQQHDPPAGLQGADLSVLVHGDDQQAVHDSLLSLAGVHQEKRAGMNTEPT